MSLLATPVYANPSTPLWVSVGGSHTGPITGRPITALDLSGNSSLLLLGTNPSNSYIQSAGTINFGQIGTGNVNTSLAISPAGSNTDVLTVGGSIISKSDIRTQDASGGTGIRMTTTAPGVNYLQVNDALLFTLPGQGSGNSSLQVKPLGQEDILTVGGFCDAYRLGTTSTNQPDSSAGTATLSNGTVTVSTTASDVTAQIMITRTAINGSTAVGNLRVSNQGANDFTVVSCRDASPTTTETGDQSSFAWFIINGS